MTTRCVGLHDKDKVTLIDIEVPDDGAFAGPIPGVIVYNGVAHFYIQPCNDAPEMHPRETAAYLKASGTMIIAEEPSKRVFVWNSTTRGWGSE